MNKAKAATSHVEETKETKEKVRTHHLLMDGADSMTENTSVSPLDQTESTVSTTSSYQYAMYTLTNQDGYRGVTSKRPPRAVSLPIMAVTHVT